MAVILSMMWESWWLSLQAHAVTLGVTLLKALLVFIVGRLVISLLNRLVRKILSRRNIDPSVKTFVGSLVNVLLIVLLAVSIVAILGIETTSFAALLASAGVAVGMALSGNLSNFAGGLIILLFKPFKVGDYIEGQGESGTVREIQIFHTILTKPDNKVVYIPNGALSGGAITNYSREPLRRVDWTFGVDYGEDYQKVKGVITSIIARDTRILQEPVVRVWVASADYWDVYFDINQAVYETFNREGIDFPFPQLTVHQARN